MRFNFKSFYMSGRIDSQKYSSQNKKLFLFLIKLFGASRQTGRYKCKENKMYTKYDNEDYVDIQFYDDESIGIYLFFFRLKFK